MFALEEKNEKVYKVTKYRKEGEAHVNKYYQHADLLHRRFHRLHDCLRTMFLERALCTGFQKQIFFSSLFAFRALLLRRFELIF